MSEDHEHDLQLSRSVCAGCGDAEEFCRECGYNAGCSCLEPEYEPPAGLPKHLSPSQIQNLLDCGWRYYLERVVRVPARPMVAGIGGSVVHKMTEDIDREWFDERHAQ